MGRQARRMQLISAYNMNKKRLHKRQVKNQIIFEREEAEAHAVAMISIARSRIKDIDQVIKQLLRTRNRYVRQLEDLEEK